MKNLFDKPEDVLDHVAVNSARQVTVRWGSVWDVQSASYVKGMLIQVGATDIAVTDAQAERIADEIDGKIMSDELEDKIRAALDRHPAGKSISKGLA